MVTTEVVVLCLRFDTLASGKRRPSERGQVKLFVVPNEVCTALMRYRVRSLLLHFWSLKKHKCKIAEQKDDS